MTQEQGYKPRVILVHNFLTPYRIPLFTALARRFDLEVWLLGDVRKIREWEGTVPPGSFVYKFVPRIEIPLASRYNTLLFNYSIARMLKEAAPEVVIGCGWDAPALFYLGYYCRRAQIPFVLWSGSTPAEHSWYRFLSAPAVRYLVRCATTWIAYGTRARDYLVSLGADESRIFLAYNTVELDYFRNESQLSEEARKALRNKLGIHASHVVLYCGNLLRFKGVEELLLGFYTFAQTHADVALVYVGSGRLQHKLAGLAAKLGIAKQVHFAGYVDRKQLPRYYRIADILVLPSESEVWGLVINEALACGVPVIASEVCGAVPDLIQEEINGFVIPPRDSFAIAHALSRFFELPPWRREEMKEHARQIVAPFTIERAADAFVEAVRCAQQLTSGGE